MNGINLTSRRERGQALVLVALMAIALVAFVGLALDGAQLFEHRRVMQNAADAGAMAGAYGLGNAMAGAVIAGQVQSYTVGGGGIGNRADAWDGVYLPSGNNIKTASYAPDDNCVRVTTYVTFPTYFIGIIGFDALDTSARATACTGPIATTSSPLWPIVVMTPTVPWVYDQNVNLYFDSSTGNSNTYSPGTFGWIDFNGNTNLPNELDNWITNTYTGSYFVHAWDPPCDATGAWAGMLSLGQCVETKNGVAFNPEVPYLQSKIGMTVTILLADGGNPTGNKMYHIVSFARFYVVDVVSGGTNSYITGKFRHFVLPGEICLSNCNDIVGTKGVNLTN